MKTKTGKIIFPREGLKVESINGFTISNGKKIRIEKGEIGILKKIESMIDSKGDAIVKVKFHNHPSVKIDTMMIVSITETSSIQLDVI